MSAFKSIALKTFSLAVAFLISVAFSACGNTASENQSVIPLTVSPYEIPEDEPIYVTLYYPSQDKTRVLAFQQTLSVQADTVYTQVMDALLSGTAAGYVSPFPSGVVCRSITAVQNILYIDMSWQFGQMRSDELLPCVAVMTSTFTALSGVDFLNITVEGKQLTIGDGKMPVMLLSALTGTVSELTRVYLSEKDSMLNTFYACIYKADESGKFLLPSVTSITSGENGYTSAVLSALISGDEKTFGDYIGIADSPAYDSSTDTLSVALTCSGSWNAPNGWLAPRSVLCALSCFYPMCRRLELTVTDSSGNERYKLDEATSNYFDCVRSSINVFTPDSRGTGLTVTAMLVEQMPGSKDFSGFLREYLATVNSAFREKDGIVNGVTLNNDTIIIDLDKEYFDTYIGLDGQHEYAVVYSLIVTVCNYSSANKAVILQNGQLRSTFSGHIAIDRPLLNLPAAYTDLLK